MPTIIVMPIIEEMFSSMPVTHSPMNTTDSASSGVARIASATRKLSYRNSSRVNTSAIAASITMVRSRNACCCCAYRPPSS